jgi:hypothetical protein
MLAQQITLRSTISANMSQNSGAHGNCPPTITEAAGQLHPFLATHTQPIIPPPYLVCQIAGCNAPLVFIDRDFAALAFHLIFEHGYLPGIEYTCGWNGCQCSKSPGCREDHQTGNLHSWRGLNMLDHVVKAHLDFVDVCSKCGTGPFSRKSSRDRHEASCRRGLVQARFRSCLQVFSSIIMLGAHGGFGQCRLAS